MKKKQKDQRKEGAEHRELPAGNPWSMRSILSLCALGILSAWGLAEYASSEALYQKQNADPYFVVAQEKRFAGLVAAVPQNAVLGFITDFQPGSTAGIALRNVAQYHLAPRLLVDGSQQDLVLGDFGRKADFAAVGAGMGLTVEKDFGGGIVLYKRGAGKVTE